MSMHIYAEEGTQVVYAHPNAGYDVDQELAADYLELDQVYTVDQVHVGDSKTTICLVEFPDVWFNSVLFDDC